MKKIYIILTYTGTMLSRIIKIYTRDEFSHVSIALDEHLQEMYSFGRLHPYNPFVGGFVHEGIDVGTFKRFKNTTSAVYSLTINDEQYEMLREQIKKIGESEIRYRFNIIGLFAVALKIRIRRKYAFYCAEFIKYILENARIQTNLPKIVKPENFRQIEGLKLEYKGKLKQYDVQTEKQKCEV